MVSPDCDSFYPWDKPYSSDIAKQLNDEAFLAKVNHV